MKKRIRRILISAVMLCCLILMDGNVMAAPVSSADSAVLEIDSYEVEEGILHAGEEVTLKLAVKNTSSLADAQNVIITYDAANDMLFPVYGEDNQVYLGTIAAGKTKEVSISLMVSKNYSADFAKLNVEFDYASAGTLVNNNVTLNIPTYVSGMLSSESVIVANNATVGTNSLVSIRCKNGGTTDISDVKLVITGNVDEESREITLPIIGAGKTCTQDYYVRFTESGIQTLQVAYEYMDAQGTVYTVDGGEYKVNVTTSPVSSESNVVMVGQTSGISTIMMQIVLLFIAAVAIIITIVVFVRKRK